MRHQTIAVRTDTVRTDNYRSGSSLPVHQLGVLLDPCLEASATSILTGRENVPACPRSDPSGESGLAARRRWSMPSRSSTACPLKSGSVHTWAEPTSSLQRRYCRSAPTGSTPRHLRPLTRRAEGDCSGPPVTLQLASAMPRARNAGNPRFQIAARVSAVGCQALSSRE